MRLYEDITSKQLNYISILQNDLGLSSREFLINLLNAEFNWTITSLSQLNVAQASDVITYLRRLKAEK